MKLKISRVTGQNRSYGYYRTYKELKLPWEPGKSKIWMRYYRTYKELKLNVLVTYALDADCYYRTYKELKQLLRMFDIVTCSARYYRTYKELKLGSIGVC